MFWGPADRISSPTEKINAKQLLESVHSNRFCRVQNLLTSSVELIWPITELYFRQILSTDFMNRFYQDVNTGPYKQTSLCASNIFYRVLFSTDSKLLSHDSTNHYCCNKKILRTTLEWSFSKKQ